jgi:hypothetical protein
MLVHQSAKRTIPIALDIEEFYRKDVSHFITHFGMPGNKFWNTEVFFGGRYVLSLQVPVTVDHQRDTVNAVGPSVLVLTEIQKVVRLENGNAQASTGRSWTFDETDWTNIAEYGVIDFSRVGVKTDQSAVANFDFYKSEVLKDRIPVKLSRGQ